MSQKLAARFLHGLVNFVGELVWEYPKIKRRNYSCWNITQCLLWAFLLSECLALQGMYGLGYIWICALAIVLRQSPTDLRDIH